MDLLSKLVGAVDRWQRRWLGIAEFSDDPACVLRLGFTAARAETKLADGTVGRPGERIGVLHLWNEHMPQIPLAGPDLGWARALNRSVVHSLRLLARHVAGNPALEDVRAFRGEFAIVYSPGAVRLLRRLGFEVLDLEPPLGPVGWVVDPAQRLWIWLLRRAFNPASARGLRLGDVQRRELWMGRRTLMRMYGDGNRDLETTKEENEYILKSSGGRAT